MTITVEIPMTLPSASNLRLHWAKRARLVKAQRASTALMLRANRLAGRLEGHATSLRVGDSRLAVTLTRVAPRQLDDDNLRGAFKAVRDEVAAYFGVNDNDPRIEWRYAQAKGRSAVRIEFAVTAREVAA